MAREFDQLHQDIADFLRASRDEFQDPIRLAVPEESPLQTPPKSFTQEFKEWASDKTVRNCFIKPILALIAAVAVPTTAGVLTGDAGLVAIIGYGEQAAIIVGMGAYAIKETLGIRIIRQAPTRD